MAISKKLTIVFVFFYLIILVYILLFFFVPSFQESIIKSRRNIGQITEGSNYYWALLIAFLICLIGSASIGFPIPFPFVLFTICNSIYSRYNYILTPLCWIEILGIIIIGGLGAFLGEYTSFMVGKGAKKIAEKSDSKTLENLKGFGRLVLDNPKRTNLYVFIGAATPIPDDALMIALAMLEDENGNPKYPFRKIIIPGWCGKNVTTFFYCLLPILIRFSFLLSGYEFNDFSDVITEAIMLLVTITIMFFIMGFDWNKYLENKKKITNRA
ncbi:MAG: hypothetical protein ACTSQJ_16700 [Promethearchaeota archaeon]